MDAEEKVLSTPIQFIPLPFKCKGTPYDLALRHDLFPIKISCIGGHYPSFSVNLTVKVLGAKDMIQKKAAATSNACDRDGFEDLCD